MGIIGDVQRPFMMTIVIPTYRRNMDLSECLDSIRENSCYSHEIIVLSPESDTEILEICEINNAIFVLDGSRECGNRTISLWSIINKGIEMASNGFVAWLNDDCVVQPNWDRIVEHYFSLDMGLVVMKASGINNDPRYRLMWSHFGIPCANYGVLRKSTDVRFDEKYSWFYGDADISLEVLNRSAYNVVATNEGLVDHKHRQDQNRTQNENSPVVKQDEARFMDKWRYYKLKGGRVVHMNAAEKLYKRTRSLLVGIKLSLAGRVTR